MRTSSANRTLSDAGFSLVELLAVLAIMSLMVGAVVMNLPQGPTAANRQTEAMTVQIQARLDQAARRGEMRALGVDEDGLSLFAERNGEIVAEADFPWPDGLRVTVEAGEAPLKLAEDATPQFWIEPYGDVPDLVVRLGGSRESYRLAFDARGRFTREAVR